MNIKLKRKIINSIALLLSMAAMAFSLFWLIWILWMVCEKGVSSLSLTLLTENTPPPGSAGGLKNAIAGKGAMPPKGGGADLSDAEVKAAVEHLVGLSK